MAALIGSPLNLAGIPALAAENSSFNGSSFLAVSAILNPNIDVQKNDHQKQNGLAVLDNVFLQSLFHLNQKNETDKTESVLAVASVKKVLITAYSSTPDQTDDSPFVTANGTYVYDGVIACNFLPFGTKVRLPDFSGDKVYTVHDRMAKRFSYKMDIWMESRELALEFGVKKLTVEILE